MTREEEREATPAGLARDTGPDIPRPARRLLLHLAEQVDPGTGAVSLTMAEIVRGLHQSHRWVVHNVGELELAGLVLLSRDPHCDWRRNLYTVNGVETSWAVAIPRVPYSRHGFYLLHQGIAQLEHQCRPAQRKLGRDRP